MGEVIIGLLIAVLGLLGFGAFKSRKLEQQKEKTREAEAKSEIREKQMEVVHDVRKELGIIEEEKPPQKTAAPVSGDSSDRLDRLNRLHHN